MGKEEALSLQLVRPDDGVDDEYYFKDVAGNGYLAVDYDESMLAIDERYIKYWSDLPDRPSLRFEDSRSEATLFRIKDCGPSFDAAFDLRIGSRVCYFAHLHDYHAQMALAWRSNGVKARIVDLKQEAFGRMVTLKCDGFGYDNDGFPEKIDFKVKLNAESHLIGDYNLSDRHSRFEVEDWESRMWESKKTKKQRAKERWIEKEGEIGDFQKALCEPLRVNPKYEKRVKS